MKRLCLLALPLLIALSGCNDAPFPNRPESAHPDPANEDAGIIVPEDSLIAYTRAALSNKLGKNFWSEAIHDNYVYLCAIKLGLSPARAGAMRDAAHMPDVFQCGLDHAYNQQWSHAYIYLKTPWGPQPAWGDADDDFHDNIDGETSELESPEGYNGKWAGYYYKAGRQALGDWYVGYACHYIADVCFCLHTTVPDYDMAARHFDFETWIQNNWTSGYNFSATAKNIPAWAYYNVSDLKSAVQSAALNANVSYNANAKNAWEFYKLSGFPTASGSGNQVAAYYTRKMVEEAAKWTGGAIRHTLTKYGQW